MLHDLAVHAAQAIGALITVGGSLNALASLAEGIRHAGRLVTGGAR